MKHARDIYLLVSIPIVLILIGITVTAFAGYRETFTKVLNDKKVFQTCASELEDAKPPTGQDTLTTLVDKNGKVLNFTYKSASGNTVKMGACVSQKVKAMTFAAPSEGKEISFETYIDWGGFDPGMTPEGTGDNLVQKEDIRLAITKKMAGFEKCYRGYVDGGGKGRGKIVLAWLIGTKGQVEKPTARNDEIKNEKLANCLIKVLSQIKFKAPPKGVVPDVSYPFLFAQ